MKEPIGLEQIEERFLEEDTEAALRRQRFVELLQDYFRRKEARL